MILLFKASLVVIFLLAFYKLFLERESFFSANRVYLLGCLVMACILPFIVLPKMIDHQGIVDNLFDSESVIVDNIERPNTTHSEIDTSSSFENIADNNKLIDQDITKYSTEPTEADLSTQGPIIVGESEKSSSKGLSFYLFILYLFGVFVLTINLLAQIGNVALKVINNRDKIEDEGKVIVNMSGDVEPCSFFNYIFINPSNYDFDTYEQIIAHEKVHVTKKHSIDLLLSEIAIIVLWFNPFMWLMRREVEKNIEYQTDQTLLQDEADIKELYQLNLVKIACNTSPLAITTNYNQSLIKQRILRMNAKRSNKFSYMKYAFCLPLIFILLLVLNKPMDGISQTADLVNMPEDTNIQDENGNGELKTAQDIQKSEPEIPNTKSSESLAEKAMEIPKAKEIDNKPETILDSRMIADCEEFEKAVAAGDLTRVKEILKTLDPDCLKIKKNEKSNLMAVENLVSEKRTELDQKRKEKMSAEDVEKLDVCERLKVAVRERNTYKTKIILQNEDISCLKNMNGGESNDIELIKGLLSYDANIDIYNGSFIKINNIGFFIDIKDHSASDCKDPKYLKLVKAIQEYDNYAIRQILYEGGLTCPLNENGVRNDFVFIKELMKYDPIIDNHSESAITVGGIAIEIDMNAFESDFDRFSNYNRQAYEKQANILKDIENSISDSKHQDVQITCVELIDAILVGDNGLAKDIVQEISPNCFHRVTKTISNDEDKLVTSTVHTPLISAVRAQNKKLVQMLLKQGADVNYSGDGKETALVAGAKLGNKEIVQLLVKSGAELNRKDEAGFSALDYARLKDFDDLYQFLKSIGAR